MGKFIKGDPRTIASGRKGGTTGKKHFENLPPQELKELASQAGIQSGIKRKQQAK